MNYALADGYYLKSEITQLFLHIYVYRGRIKAPGGRTMRISLEQFKKDVLFRLEDETYNVEIVDSKERSIKQFKYCNTERILMFIADYAEVCQENDVLFIDADVFKEFIRIRTKENGYITVDISLN